MSPKAILNYTTQIPAMQSVGEIMGILSDAGAKAITIDYDQGNPNGLEFVVETKFGERAFRLPANIPAALASLKKDRERGLARAHTGAPTEEQAARVAWRIIRDWTEAQLAIIRLGMVELQQVMLPYMLIAEGRTVYELMERYELKALPPGRKEGEQ